MKTIIPDSYRHARLLSLSPVIPDVSPVISDTLSVIPDLIGDLLLKIHVSVPGGRRLAPQEAWEMRRSPAVLWGPGVKIW